VIGSQRNCVHNIVEVVCVCVERHSGGGVPEHSLDCFHVGAGAHRQAGCSVAKVVRGDSLEVSVKVLALSDCRREPPTT
jgi:hypothetical protein